MKHGTTKKCCENEAKKAIEHTFDELAKKHTIERMYKQWEIERGKHADEVGKLRDALFDNNSLIKKLCKHIGRGV